MEYNSFDITYCCIILTYASLACQNSNPIFSDELNSKANTNNVPVWMCRANTKFGRRRQLMKSDARLTKTERPRNWLHRRLARVEMLSNAACQSKRRRRGNKTKNALLGTLEAQFKTRDRYLINYAIVLIWSIKINTHKSSTQQCFWKKNGNIIATA